jgi:hypothetical protein
MVGGELGLVRGIFDEAESFQLVSQAGDQFGVRREAKRHAALESSNAQEMLGSPKAVSPLRSATAVQNRSDSGGRESLQSAWQTGDEFGVRREAKRHAALESSNAQEMLGSPKAVSPLRSTTAVQSQRRLATWSAGGQSGTCARR